VSDTATISPRRLRHSSRAPTPHDGGGFAQRRWWKRRNRRRSRRRWLCRLAPSQEPTQHPRVIEMDYFHHTAAAAADAAGRWTAILDNVPHPGAAHALPACRVDHGALPPKRVRRRAPQGERHRALPPVARRRDHLGRVGTFHHVLLQPNHTLKLMTAGVVHATNLTPPGSECNPTPRRRLSTSP
jgi:hypothetical protein